MVNVKAAIPNKLLNVIGMKLTGRLLVSEMSHTGRWLADLQGIFGTEEKEAKKLTEGTCMPSEHSWGNV